MSRHLVINILLVIAGIVLALALFGAGAMWKGRIQPVHPSVSAPAFTSVWRRMVRFSQAQRGRS